MPDAFIEFQQVWKKFRRGELHDSLRDLIPAVGRRLLGRAERTDSLAEGGFWALRDVSFEVRPGQTLGIIGRNGAGKSTVLKMVSRILRPTRGSCRVQGRLGALIEVAAGFHPDLTGRENVFLQGAIMGMRSATVRSLFDEIVEFSGIADFIDTPVKRYSSGMSARLGFSVAAHLEPDVLVIDEVLSVGDYAFQKKAFQRISKLAKSGIPVVVVSHQLEMIATLCTEAILLQHGEVVERGTPADCIAAYVLGEKLAPGSDPDESPVQLESTHLKGLAQIRSGDWARFSVSGKVRGRVTDDFEWLALRCRALNTNSVVFATGSAHYHLVPPPLGAFSVDVELQLNVPPGLYVVETVVWDQRRLRDAFLGPKLLLEVIDGPSFYGRVQMNASIVPVARAEGAGSLVSKLGA